MERQTQLTQWDFGPCLAEHLRTCFNSQLMALGNQLLAGSRMDSPLCLRVVLLGDGFKHMLNLKHVPSSLLIEGFSEKVLVLLFLLGACPCAHVSRHITTVWKSKAF